MLIRTYSSRKNADSQIIPVLSRLDRSRLFTCRPRMGGMASGRTERTAAVETAFSVW